MIHTALWVASAWFLASIGVCILFALWKKWDRELKRRNYARVWAEEAALRAASQRRRAQRVGQDLLDILEKIDVGDIDDNRRWIH